MYDPAKKVQLIIKTTILKESLAHQSFVFKVFSSMPHCIFCLLQERWRLRQEQSKLASLQKAAEEERKIAAQQMVSQQATLQQAKVDFRGFLKSVNFGFHRKKI